MKPIKWWEGERVYYDTWWQGVWIQTPAKPGKMTVEEKFQRIKEEGG